jgi:hypothetical protein
MYDPIQDGIDKKVQSVKYTEAAPPPSLSSLVHCFWELKTTALLVDDFELLAVPDACVNKGVQYDNAKYKPKRYRMVRYLRR